MVCQLLFSSNTLRHLLAEPRLHARGQLSRIAQEHRQQGKGSARLVGEHRSGEIRSLHEHLRHEAKRVEIRSEAVGTLLESTLIEAKDLRGYTAAPSHGRRSTQQCAQGLLMRQPRTLVSKLLLGLPNLPLKAPTTLSLPCTALELANQQLGAAGLLADERQAVVQVAGACVRDAQARSTLDPNHGL